MKNIHKLRKAGVIHKADKPTKSQLAAIDGLSHEELKVLVKFFSNMPNMRAIRFKRGGCFF